MNILSKYITVCFTKGRPKPPNQITPHTAVSNASSLYDFFQSGTRGSSASCYVNKDGIIEQYVADGDTPWTNANFPSNQRSLTFETWDGGNANDPVRTDAMYESAAQLIAYWSKKYNIPIV